MSRINVRDLNSSDDLFPDELAAIAGRAKFLIRKHSSQTEDSAVGITYNLSDPVLAKKYLLAPKVNDKDNNESSTQVEA
ncbi:MAG: hypothetical protein KME21_13160 [Desmonostoc vinosum HA7617-LM4]|jgi:hypothetical protein|nr:hypothetical protein [Desmonostoc vinosum HA7617-LM4]